MLHPVGNLPAHVYWRRRLFFVVLPVVGVALIAWALLSGGGDHASPSNTASTTTKSSHTPTATTPPVTRDTGSVSVGTAAASTTRATTPAATTKPASTKPGSTTPASTGPSVAASGKGFCAADDLMVASGVAHPSFPVKSKPVLYMPVTNVGTTACKLDVADKHDEWLVYTGDARVWGSHDCAVEAGTNVISVAPQQTVRLSITWSGLTSTPGCKGTRLAVQAGTYRVYAYLNGERSAPTTFTIR